MVPQQPIIVGTDGSSLAERAVLEAAALARGSGSPLVIVTAFPDLHPHREHVRSASGEVLIDQAKVAEQVMQRAAAQAGDEGLAIDFVSRRGHPADVLADVAEERGARMVVVGDRGLWGVKRFLLGSVSSRVAHHTRCTVLLVRSRMAK